MIGNASARGPTLPAMAPFARLPVGLRRRVYRLAYALAVRLLVRLRARSTHGVKCVLTDGDRVLLVRHTYGQPRVGAAGRRDQAPESRRCTPPGARCTRSSASTSTTGPSLGEVTGRVQHRRDTLHCFHAEIDKPALTLDLGELAAARWFALGELPADLGELRPPDPGAPASGAPGDH